jgi:hypothetical protein
MNFSILMLAARIALAVSLYAFLLLILIALWQDLRSAGGAGPGEPRPNLHRLREDGTLEHVFPLTKNSCFIGRSSSVEVSLADETVSVVHARLWQKEGRWWLEDLDSRNGTQLNQIPVTRRTILCTGDRIRVGRVQLEFRTAESPPTGYKPSSAAEPPPC